MKDIIVDVTCLTTDGSYISADGFVKFNTMTVADQQMLEEFIHYLKNTYIFSIVWKENTQRVRSIEVEKLYQVIHKYGDMNQILRDMWSCPLENLYGCILPYLDLPPNIRLFLNKRKLLQKVLDDLHDDNIMSSLSYILHDMHPIIYQNEW